MLSTSTLPQNSHPKNNFGFYKKQRIDSFSNGTSTKNSSLCYSFTGSVFPFTVLYQNTSKKYLHLKRLSIVAAASSSGSRSSRTVYKQSQAQAPAAQIQGIASFVLPAGAFVVVTFVLWKLVEKILLPKPTKSPSEENTATQGVKWSFAPGTNLLSSFGAKVERESKLRLNDFAKELRSFRSVDMSGRNFGDEGLFFLAESLAYNQTAEEVDFAANGLTADGVKAFDGVLQSNIMLKTLNLSGNSIRR